MEDDRYILTNHFKNEMEFDSMHPNGFGHDENFQDLTTSDVTGFSEIAHSDLDPLRPEGLLAQHNDATRDYRAYSGTAGSTFAHPDNRAPAVNPMDDTNEYSSLLSLTLTLVCLVAFGILFILI